MTILEQYKDYCNREYKDAVRAIENKRLFKPREVVDNAIDRCLGVALFVQSIGVSYEDADIVYEETKAKLEELKGLTNSQPYDIINISKEREVNKYEYYL